MENILLMILKKLSSIEEILLSVYGKKQKKEEKK